MSLSVRFMARHRGDHPHPANLREMLYLPPVRVRYPVVMPNQIASVMMRVTASSTGDGLSRLDRGEVELVVGVLGWRGRRGSGAPLGGFDLEDPVQVEEQGLGVLPGNRGDGLACPFRDGAGVVGCAGHRAAFPVLAWNAARPFGGHT